MASNHQISMPIPTQHSASPAPPSPTEGGAGNISGSGGAPHPAGDEEPIPTSINGPGNGNGHKVDGPQVMTTPVPMSINTPGFNGRVEGHGSYDHTPTLRPPVFREPISALNRLVGNGFFLSTLVVSVFVWIMAIISQAFVTSRFGNAPISTLWLALFLDLFLLILLGYALVTSTLSSHIPLLHSLSLTTFILGALGVDRNIFSDRREQQAVAAAWVLLCIITAVWVVVFASERGGMVWAVVEGMGDMELMKDSGQGVGGMENIGMKSLMRRNVKSEAYSVNANTPTGPAMSVPLGSAGDGQTFLTAGEGEEGRVKSGSAYGWNDAIRESNAFSQAQSNPGRMSAATSGAEAPLPLTNERVLALYPYEASVQDPTEISFAKGEVMQVIERAGKWWTVRKENGVVGIIPSNYVQLVAR